VTGEPTVDITQEARNAVLEVLGTYVQAQPEMAMDGAAWDRLADEAIRAAMPWLRYVEPPITQRQNELDGETVATLRAQRLAAESQAEHSRALAALVESSHELSYLQTQLAQRQIAEMDAGVTEYTLWRDALLIAATTCLHDDIDHLVIVARPIRESLRMAGYPPPTFDDDASSE
jgi:hypothetical protein